MVSIAPALVGKQAANQARASNPRSPPGSTGNATDTDTHSRSPLRGAGGEEEAGEGERGGGGRGRAQGIRVLVERGRGRTGRKGKRVAAEVGVQWRRCLSLSMKLRKLFEASVELVAFVFLLVRCCEFATQHCDGSYILSRR